MTALSQSERVLQKGFSRKISHAGPTTNNDVILLYLTITIYTVGTLLFNMTCTSI